MKSILPFRINPLFRKNDTNGSALIYKYYASFSMPFARAALDWLKPRKDGIVLDPWNGSGTTTTAAFHKGLRSLGLDINPATLIISRARLLTRRASLELESLAKKVCYSDQAKYTEFDSDPLRHWFDDRTVGAVRSVERNILESLGAKTYGGKSRNTEEIKNLNEIACFIYVAFFRTLRKIAAPFSSKNPTWIKTASASLPKVRVPAKEFVGLLIENINNLVMLLPAWTERVPLWEKPMLSLGNSENLPLGDESIDCVITSPPYCTRIDYAIAMRLELAMLGFSDAEFRELRRSMLGSTVLKRDILKPKREWGSACLHFLSKVAAHQAKGSRTYYFNLHSSYFGGLHKSISEIARVLTPGGKLLLVARDSYYQNIRNDLPAIIEQMGRSRSLSLLTKRSFDQNYFGNINNRRHEKRKTSREEIIAFCKP